MTDTTADRSAAPRDSRITTRFVQANGLTFEVDQCGEGDKLAICLHGFPESSYSWRYQLPMLADQGYTAWAPNLRGYGKSSRPPFVEDYAMQHLLDDVAGLIDAAGKQEVVLMAHDWGAVIAWQFAMAKVRPLTKLIICNVPHPVAMQKAFSFAQLKKSWYVFFFQIPGLAEKLLGRHHAQPIADMFQNTCVDKSMFPQEVVEVYRKNAAQPRRPDGYGELLQSTTAVSSETEKRRKIANNINANINDMGRRRRSANERNNLRHRKLRRRLSYSLSTSDITLGSARSARSH